MKIVADAGIFNAEASFAQFDAELLLLPGREISPEDVRDADALFVRSITRVDSTLLEQSKVRFVATATSGVDHIDIDYLNSRNIKFIDAKGCNARAVVEYCLTAMAYLITKGRLDAENFRVGIVGAGHVGGLLSGKLAELNIPSLVYDPPLENSDSDSSFDFRALEDVLQCDVVSLHVPLIEEGQYPTRGLVSEAVLAQLPSGSILINTCRGGVVDEASLVQLLQSRADIDVVFDVWENEPLINVPLADLVTLCTPHIAGYSVEAKQVATECVLASFAEFIGTPFQGSKAEASSDKSLILESSSSMDSDSSKAPWLALQEMFDIDQLTETFRQSLRGNDPASQFDELRRALASRREFSSFSASTDSWDSQVVKFLEILGVGRV